MLTYMCAFLVATVFQVTLCQQSDNGPPVECFKAPPGAGEARPHTCCNVEPTRSEADLEECGFQDDPRFDNDCSREICALRKFHLLKEDGITLDWDAVERSLDEWGEANPGFEKGVELAKKSCLKSDLPGPPGLCLIFKIHVCNSYAVVHDCPRWEDSEECAAVKSHMQKCNHYFAHETLKT